MKTFRNLTFLALFGLAMATGPAELQALVYPYEWTSQCDDVHDITWDGCLGVEMHSTTCDSGYCADFQDDCEDYCSDAGYGPPDENESFCNEASGWSGFVCYCEHVPCPVG